jgi:hypothetical protein
VIDPDAQKRAFDAAVERHCADARATGATETREWLREDIARLQKEILIASSIVAELFSALRESDPERAGHVSEGVLSQHEKYQDDPHFPNVRDLLATFSRLR